LYDDWKRHFDYSSRVDLYEEIKGYAPEKKYGDDYEDDYDDRVDCDLKNNNSGIALGYLTGLMD